MPLLALAATLATIFIYQPTSPNLMPEHTSRVLRITARRAQTADIVSLSTLPQSGDQPAFIAGQVAVLQADDEAQPSYFALASAPEDATLDFLIKRGAPASNRLADLQTGDSLLLNTIVGKGFPLDDYQGRDLIMIAMGTGIAPLRSALRHALARRASFGKIFMLYGARTPTSFSYADEAESWRAQNVDVRLVISRPEGSEWTGATGYVQSLLDNVLPDLTSPVALVCGSKEMMTTTRERLLTMGFSEPDVMTNY